RTQRSLSPVVRANSSLVTVPAARNAPYSPSRSLNDLDAEMHGYAHYRYHYPGRYGRPESSPDDGGREERTGGSRGA
ncbi:MAG: hypothetical protein LAO51_11690, partial [Acidobacteriia bacterium]|nr:hypothetical protein [Terriglobia bacterium]